MGGVEAMTELAYYASRTGTRRNLEALRLAGFEVPRFRAALDQSSMVLT